MMKILDKNSGSLLAGLLFVSVFALACLYLAQLPLFIKSGISPLIIAIILAIFYGNTLYRRLHHEWSPGINFAAKRLLRLAIILYGFRVSFQEIASVGIIGLAIDIIVVSTIIGCGYLLGVKVLKLDRHLALLISAGSAICGAAAVLAVENALKSEPYKASVAVGTVVLFGTISMFLYPLLQQMGLFGFSDHQFGIFAGASIHEVAQALVAGTNVSNQAGNIAVVVKMTRVILLVPMLFILATFENVSAKKTGNSSIKMTIPWFAIIFVLVIGFNSLHVIPNSWVNLINQLDTFLLTMAMAAIGMETNLAQIKKVGLKPLYLAIFLFGLLSGGVYLLVKFMG